MMLVQAAEEFRRPSSERVPGGQSSTRLTEWTAAASQLWFCLESNRIFARSSARAASSTVRQGSGFRVLLVELLPVAPGKYSARNVEEAWHRKQQEIGTDIPPA